jgi:hypothetical protein
MSISTLFSDLEMGLHRWQAGRYTLELRFTGPGSDTDERLVRAGEHSIQIEAKELRARALDHVAYGSFLTDILFAAPEVRSLFDRARQAAENKGVPLRLRLFVGPNATELHTIRWEMLRDPGRDVPLLTGERIYFSRYLSGRDGEPAQLRPKTALSGLVVIANPTDLAEYGLDVVDVAGELKRTRLALGDIAITELASTGAATLENLIDGLRRGQDILYLVCHGKLVKGEPWLWLEKEKAPPQQGQTGTGGSPPGSVTHLVPGDELVTRLAELQQRPRLVVLASCQSAGKGESAPSSRDKGALAALGPKLAEAGISAVLAMQGCVTMATVADFMPRFFQELTQDGQIDRAMSLARGTVRDRPDWWVPVLFMRIRDGRIWTQESRTEPDAEDVSGGEAEHRVFVQTQRASQDSVIDKSPQTIESDSDLNLASAKQTQNADDQSRITDSPQKIIVRGRRRLAADSD